MAQSVGAVQVVPQAVPLHTNGSHLAVVTGRHIPAPSHIRAEVTVPAVHVAVVQVVRAEYRRHPPFPSQVPSRPQVVDASVAHVSFGSWPAGTGVQVPGLAGRLQATHTLVHVLSQQTLSAQNPEAHSVAARHVSPSARCEDGISVAAVSRCESGCGPGRS